MLVVYPAAKIRYAEEEYIDREGTHNFVAYPRPPRPAAAAQDEPLVSDEAGGVDGERGERVQGVLCAHCRWRTKSAELRLTCW